MARPIDTFSRRLSQVYRKRGYTARMTLLRVAPGLATVFWAAAISISAASNAPPPSPDLLAVKTVYILPMRSGFDQYLANELARSGSVRVVTDPIRADAVLTDHLGESFQERMDDLFPTPPKPHAKPEPKSADSKTESKDDSAASADEPPVATRPISSGSNGRGNVFLVGRQDRTVLWSDFRSPRSRRPEDMKRAADSVASDLKRALQPPNSGSK